MQAVPGFDAKGIETVRRDTCPAVAKTMERSLRLLFATRDLSEVMPHTHTSPISRRLYQSWKGLKEHAPHLDSTAFQGTNLVLACIFLPWNKRLPQQIQCMLLFTHAHGPKSGLLVDIKELVTHTWHRIHWSVS